MTHEDQRLASLQSYVDELRTATTHHERVQAARKLANASRIVEHDVIGDARRDGVTWQEIGDIHGITRQGAFQRFTSHEAHVRDLGEGTAVEDR